MACAPYRYTAAQAAFRRFRAQQLTRSRRFAAPPPLLPRAAQEALYEKRVEMADRERVEQARPSRTAAISRPRAQRSA